MRGFTTEGLTEGLNSESFDTKLNALTVRQRIQYFNENKWCPSYLIHNKDSV